MKPNDSPKETTIRPVKFDLSNVTGGVTLDVGGSHRSRTPYSEEKTKEQNPAFVRNTILEDLEDLQDLTVEEPQDDRIAKQKTTGFTIDGKALQDPKKK